MKKPIVHKKHLKLYEETAKQRVLVFLMRYPEKEFSLSDIAREADVAKANVGNILDDFYKNNLIKIEKLSKIWRIRANQESWDFLKLKATYNLMVIYQSSLVEHLIEKYNNPKAIVLFGSFRYGQDLSSSDIDIAIEVDDVKEHRTVELEGEDFFGAEKRKIQLHLFNRKHVDINVFNNIANGIVLSGFLEVKP